MIFASLCMFITVVTPPPLPQRCSSLLLKQGGWNENPQAFP